MSSKQENASGSWGFNNVLLDPARSVLLFVSVGVCVRGPVYKYLSYKYIRQERSSSSADLWMLF